MWWMKYGFIIILSVFVLYEALLVARAPSTLTIVCLVIVAAQWGFVLRLTMEYWLESR